MFGVDNTGVINQRQSPAIWQSDIADFPPNYILGRILIDTFFGGIYIDTASTRLQISNGSKNFINGIANYGGSPTNNNIGLGGDLQSDVNIALDGNQMTFQGQVEEVRINIDGYLQSGVSGNYLPVIEDSFFALIPDVVLKFTDGENNKEYQVLAKIK